MLTASYDIVKVCYDYAIDYVVMPCCTTCTTIIYIYIYIYILLLLLLLLLLSMMQ